MSEITHLSAAGLAAAIRRGTLSAAEAVEAYLARIASVDPAVGAYVAVLAERARLDARVRDTELRRGGPRGPLHGVPVAIKDLVAVRGVAMTAGSAFLGREPSPEDATVVRRLEGAGAIVLGTTTLHEFALGMTSRNPHGRTPRNPWDLARIAGGSSGGSAAAVAAGLAAAAVGTDTGGSIRVPAGLCGVVGLKPTFGRVSRAGVLPLAASYDTVGPMTRTVEDAALLLDATAGPDALDPRSSAHPAGPSAPGSADPPDGLRIGRLGGPYFESGLDPAAAGAVDDAARALRDAGLPVVPVRLAAMEEGQRAQVTILLAEAAAFHDATYPGRRGEYGPDVRSLLEEGRAVPAAALEEARAAERRLAAEVAVALREVDVLLGPALPIGAPALDDVDPEGSAWQRIRGQLGRFSRLYNVTGLPALVVPAGLTTDGLPVAVQLASRSFAEGPLLRIGRFLEGVLGWSLPVLPRPRGVLY